MRKNLKKLAKEQYLAIAEIRRIVKEKSIRSYHGLLGELFEVKHPKFAKSVEKVAGGRLFFHVVEDDDAAAELISEMAQRKTGRYNFFQFDYFYKKTGLKQTTLLDKNSLIKQS